MKTEQPKMPARSRKLGSKSGCDLVIAAGGDGTIGETADGLLKSGLAADALPCFAIFPCGTGSDFARSIGMAGNFGNGSAHRRWRGG